MAAPWLRLNVFWFCVASGFFLLLVALGSVPGTAEALSQSFGDKWLHSLAYGLLAALYFQAYRGSKLARCLTSVATLALLSALDETVQAFLPYRNASLADWCFDMAAALLVVGLLASCAASAALSGKFTAATPSD